MSLSYTALSSPPSLPAGYVCAGTPASPGRPAGAPSAPLSVQGGPHWTHYITDFGSKLLFLADIAERSFPPHSVRSVSLSRQSKFTHASLSLSVSQSLARLLPPRHQVLPKPWVSLCLKSSYIRKAKSAPRLLISQPLKQLNISQDSCSEMVDSQSLKTPFSASELAGEAEELL